MARRNRCIQSFLDDGVFSRNREGLGSSLSYGDSKFQAAHLTPKILETMSARADHHVRSIRNDPDLEQLEDLLETKKYAFAIEQNDKFHSDQRLISIHDEQYRDSMMDSGGDSKVRYRERSPSVERHILDDIRWIGWRIVSRHVASRG